MSSFTDDFFSNSNNKYTSTKSTSTKKKKKKDYDIDNFTDSFFEDYSSSDDTKTKSSYSNNFYDEYNTFIDELNSTRIDYYNMLQNNKEKRNNEQIESYYENNKNALKQKRTNDLIYNWNWQDAGGTSYDYGAAPIQNDKGYLKKTDSSGNVYWVDAKEDLLYDSNGNLIDDDRLNDSKFINNLKYEYDKNAKSNINTKALKRNDKVGVTTIDYSKYKFLIDNENNNIENNRKKFEQAYLNKYEFFNKNQQQLKNQNYTKFKNPYDTYRNVYEDNFEKLNKAIEKGDITTANNALQEINKKYFGHQYEDGWWSSIFNNNSDDMSFFQNKFQDNVEQLNIINDSIKNTKDADLLEELEKEKNKLELENTLIQYNRLYAYHSDMNLLDKMDKINKPVDEAWDKVSKLWNETFDEWDNGYQFGDIFKTAKNTFNNIIQTIGTLGKQTNAGIQGIETLAVSDMDDSEFKDTWLPAIMDVGTYLIPYVGTARMYINYAEPGSVVAAGVTREGSATIDSGIKDARIPNLTNVIGAATNIVANYASDKIFKSIRSKMSPETLKNIYSNQGKAIALSIFKEASGESFEEFIQTYAEYAQNMNSNIDSFSSFGDFLSDHFDEAIKSATIAAVTAGGASTLSSGIGAIRNVGTPEANADVVDNIRINRSIKEDSNTTLFNVSNTKKFENLKPDTLKHSQVDLQVDSDATVEIATELENGNIITLLDTNAIKSNSKQNIDLNNVSDTTVLSDAVINNNIKTVLVPSKEIETYIKNLRDDLTVYTIDPKSDTFMDDVRTYIAETNKSNIVTKNASDFIPSDYTFTPDEMTQINKMVNESINKGNLLDNINKPDTYKLNPITVSDITDSDINTIMNTIRNKFLNEIDNNRISKETAIKEFKQLNNKLSEYAQKTKQNRTYIKDDKNSIITFVKRGSNIYEAVNTLPTRDANLETFANVKTNGNIINGNLNQKVKFSNKQMNTTNNLIDKLGLKGNYITSDSTYKDIATLVKSNLEFSKEILQSLGADGLIEGKVKTRLYTAFDNLDNANPKGAIQNTNKLLESEEFKNEIKTKAETMAPKQVTKKVEPSKIDIESEPIKVKDVAYDINNTTEINNAEFEELWNKAFSDIKITDKMTKVKANKLKTTVRKLFFDRYVHIRDIANNNSDYNVKEAIANLEAVASDAQNMISSAQTNSNGEVIGKSLKQIYSQLNGKKQKQLFEKYIMLELNIERENAGVDKIFENMSKTESRKLADGILKKNPKFKEIANDLQRYNNNLLDMLVDGGVINKELSNKLKNRYKFYMPIYSSDLSTFADLNSDKYFKNMKVNDTIQDVTKSGKHIQTLEKSLENKTYNVLSAIAKNKLANEMALSNNYESDGKSEMIYYSNGQPMKIKTSNDIIADISNNSLSHIADQINQIPVLKQMITTSNLSYKFILDPIYQVKNVVIDFTDSQLIYSKDKKNFAKNYVRAAIAVANNSEVFNEFKEIGLADLGTGWKAPKVTYDKDGTVSYNQNKFQRIFANLEAMPKLAEYLSLKDKYMKQARADYEAGKYNTTSLVSKRGQDFNKFNETIVKGHNGKPVYISRHTSTPDEIDYIKTYKQHNDGYGWWYANSPTGNKYYNSDESNKFMNDLFDKSTVEMINDKKGVFATISEEYLTPPSQEEISASGRYNYIEGYLTGKIFDISSDEGYLPFDVSNKSEIDTREKFENLEQKRRDTVTQIYTNLKNKYDKNNKYSLDDFRKYIPLIDALKLDGYTGIVSDYNNGTKEIVIFDESKFMPLKEYNELSNKNTINSKDNIFMRDIQEQVKLRAKIEAQDVNLNFNSGGTLSKALSKSGFKFVNAGMLGFDKFVTHVGKGIKTPKGMGSLLFEFTSIGLATAIANQLLNGDDEDYDKLPYYYKNNYYMIKVGDNNFFRIPKGRVQTLYDVLFEYGTGIRKEDSTEAYLESINSAFDLAVLPPDFNTAAPYAAFQAIVSNKDAFGNEIYSEEYDSTGEKIQKGMYHLLSSYFGRYGRMVKDITDDDSTTDWFNELEYYKDTTKANRHYSAALDLVTYYKNKDNVKTLDDKMMKKYIDTQNAALKSINSEINEGKRSGQTTKDLSIKYAARDDLIKSMVTNYKNFDISDEGNGVIRYYFDEHCFEYNPKNDRITKKY